MAYGPDRLLRSSWWFGGGRWDAVRGNRDGGAPLQRGAGKLWPEEGAHYHSFLEALEAEALIGGMSVVLGQGEAEHQSVRSENAFEIIYDGNGAALAQKDRFCVKCLA